MEEVVVVEAEPTLLRRRGLEGREECLAEKRFVGEEEVLRREGIEVARSPRRGGRESVVGEEPRGWETDELSSLAKEDASLVSEDL